MSAVSAASPKLDETPAKRYSSGAKLAEDSALQLPGVHVRGDKLFIANVIT